MTAERRVENEFGARGRQARPNFEARVRAQVRQLRVNHDCEVHRWRRRDGGGRCEECHYHLRDFLLVWGVHFETPSSVADGNELDVQEL